jgi:hypothetical protein
MIDVKIKGAQELIEKIKSIGPIGGKAVRNACNKQAVILNKLLKWTAPKKTGALSKAFGVIKMAPKNGLWKTFVAVRKDYEDKKTKKVPYNYAFIVNKKNNFANVTFGKWAKNANQEIIKETWKQIETLSKKKTK